MVWRSRSEDGDTQKNGFGNLRVVEKLCGHAERRSLKNACRGKNKRTRKTRKNEICVSGKEYGRHAKQEKRKFACRGMREMGHG